MILMHGVTTMDITTAENAAMSIARSIIARATEKKSALRNDRNKRKRIRILIIWRYYTNMTPGENKENKRRREIASQDGTRTYGNEI